jgi:hypothetical protein
MKIKKGNNVSLPGSARGHEAAGSKPLAGAASHSGPPRGRFHPSSAQPGPSSLSRQNRAKPTHPL